MKKTEMVKTNEFKELVKEFMILEGYGACDVKLHYEQHGLSFKPRATDSEIESRIDYFVQQVSKQNILDMKNIHVISTSNPSKILKDLVDKTYQFKKEVSFGNRIELPLNIYITSDVDIEEGEEFWYNNGGEWYKSIYRDYYKNLFPYGKKIILTTDDQLIKDNVQAIDDEFLEWFVKNPSCEEVGIEPLMAGFVDDEPSYYENMYDIIIPKEEPIRKIDTCYNFDMEIGCVQDFCRCEQEEPKQLFTDHPITELGDKEFVEAPIRECELISYDDNKYCYVKVEGIEKEIKRGYIYTKYGRCGEVDCISIEEIKELLKEEYKQELPKTEIDWTGFPKSTQEQVGYVEPKQETLEEALERIRQESFTCCSLSKSINYVTVGEREKTAFYKGAKWQAERMYSEEEVINLLETQRGNSYVAVLSATKNDELASIALNAPEPGGMKKFKKK